jgi:CDP-2,3-bis-(O-geranylgeranyl)-sn-glycerol synthase
MTLLVLKIIWLFLPAAIANMMPVFVRRLPFLATPVSVKLFGDHKTWRGIFFGTAAGIVTTYLQKIFYPVTENIALINYETAPIFLLGFILGLSALLGDLIHSFLKRWVGIPPGQPFWVIDQIDWILAAVFALKILYDVAPEINIFAIIILGLLHLIVGRIGFSLGLKDEKY